MDTDLPDVIAEVSANPNDPASGEMLIEAAWGLGEAVVSSAGACAYAADPPIAITAS